MTEPLVVEYESIGDAPVDPETGDDDQGDAGPEGIPKNEQPANPDEK